MAMTSSVMVMLECPSISDTIFGSTPLVSSSVAQVCLRSYKRTSRTPPGRLYATGSLLMDALGCGVFSVCRVVRRFGGLV